MSDLKYLVALFGILIISGIANAYTNDGAAFYCGNGYVGNAACSDCVNATNNNTYSIIYMNANIAGATGNCIDNPANFSNKIFDCNGSTISASGSGIGIYALSKENITIRNCDISEFAYGMRIRSSLNVTIENVLVHNDTIGIELRDGTNLSTIDNATAYNNTAAFALYDSNNNNISNSVARDNFGTPLGGTGDGFYITISAAVSENNILTNCSSYNNSGNGYYIDNSDADYNTFDNCTAYNNSLSGFNITDASYINITNSSSYLNNYGIVLESSGGIIYVAYSLITNTQSYQNTVDGFSLGVHNVNLTNIIARDNGGWGIEHCAGCDDSVFDTGSVYNNLGGGLYVGGGANNNILNYLLYNNSAGGQYSISEIGGGNNFFYNITIYNESFYIQKAGGGDANFTNLTIGYNATIGLINWNFVNLSISAINSTNLIVRPDFVSLNDTALPEVNVSTVDNGANITLNISSCSLTPTIYKKTGFPQTRADIIANFTSSWPGTGITCTGNVIIFNISSFSGYAVSSVTNLVTCDAITAPGYYSLITDVWGADTAITNTTCYPITVSNIVLDCAGYNITNNGTAGITYGIYVNDSITNVTVQNCPGISNYTYGIYLNETENITIINSSIYNANNTGILVYHSKYINISSTHASDNLAGLIFDFSNYSQVINSVFSNNSIYGIAVYGGSNNNIIANNTAFDNGNMGIIVEYASPSNNLTDNTVYGNNVAGIGIHNSNYNILLRNNASNNPGSGIVVYQNSSYNLLIENTAYNDSYITGFWVESSDYNNLTSNRAYNNTNGFFINGSSTNLINNTAYNNSWDGFYIYLSSTYNNLTNNTAYDNLDIGFVLESSSNNILTNNNAYNNAVDGFYAVDNTGNTFTGNNASGSATDSGFHFYNSSSNVLTNNVAFNNDYSGFFFELSSGNIINGCTASNNEYYGFGFYNNSNNTIVENSIASGATNLSWFEPGSAFGVSYSGYANFTNNTAFDSVFGFGIAYSSHVNIVNNSAYNNSLDTLLSSGIGIYGSSDVTIISNRVYKNTNGVGLLDASNNNIRFNNASNNTHGFTVAVYSGVSTDNVLTNNRAYNNTLDAFYLYGGVANNTLSYNAIYDNNYTIAIEGADYNNITYNTIDSNRDGIYMASILPITYNNFIGNNFTNTDYSFAVLGIFSDCKYNLIENNSIIGEATAIYLFDTGTNVRYNTIQHNDISDVNTSILSLLASYNSIASNTITNSSIFGIMSISTSYNNITSNDIINSSNIAIGFTDGSNNNLISNNISNSGAGIFVVNSTFGYLQNNTVYNSITGILLGGTTSFDSSNPNFSGNELYNNIYGVDIQDSNNTIITRDILIHNNTYEIYSGGSMINLTIEKTDTPEEEYITFENNSNISNLYLVSNYSSTYGRVLFTTVNITSASAEVALDRSNFLLDREFISLNASAQPNFHTAATASLYSTSCAGSTVRIRPGFPQSKAEILTGGGFIYLTTLTCTSSTCGDFDITSLTGGYTLKAAAPSSGGGGGGGGPCDSDFVIAVSDPVCPGNKVNVTVTDDSALPIAGEKVAIRGLWPWSDVKYTTGAGVVEFTLLTNGTYTVRVGGGASTYCEKTVSFDYATCAGNCYSDGDCTDTEYCKMSATSAGGVCTAVECECGDIYGHECHPYECCVDAGCAGNMTCVLNRCVPRVECLSDRDCADAEYCDSGACELVVGECGYTANHTWIPYACCNTTSCSADEMCLSHVCAPFMIDTDAKGFVDTYHIIDVTPKGSYDLAIISPDRKISRITTDANGRATFLLKMEGKYGVSLLDGGLPIKNLSVQSIKKSLPPPTEKPVTLLDTLIKNLWWLVILLLLVIGYILFKKRKVKKYKAGS